MLSTPTPSLDNRKSQRLSMQLPIKVEVWLKPKKSWEEITRIKDVSAFGTGFIISRPIKRGRLVSMTIPMPRKLRLFDYAEPQYRIWGIVRRCLKIQEPISNAEKYSIGIGFIGQTTPEEFNADPATVFEITTREEEGFWNIKLAEPNPDESDLPKEIRRHSRIKLPTNITVELLNDHGAVIAREQTVSENISYSGAAIFTTLAPQVGTFARIISDQYNVSIISIVRGVHIGNDRIQRLHVEFIDRFFPLDGII